MDIYTMKYTLTVLLFVSWLASYSQIGYIDCSPFPSKCLIVSGNDYEEVEKWLKKDTLWGESIGYVKDLFGEGFSFTTYTEVDEGNVYIIVFDEVPPENLNGYLLVGHEVLHLIQFIYETHDINFISEMESTAYLFEYLVEETFKIIHQVK